MSSFVVQNLPDFHLGEGTYGCVELINVKDETSNNTYLAAKKMFKDVSSFQLEKNINKYITNKIDEKDLKRLCKLIFYDNPKLELYVQFIAGRTAYEYIHSCLNVNGFIEVNILWHITHEICLATEELHSINLIHCDIKLDNCLFDCNNQAKLIDYSLVVENNTKLQGYGPEITYYMAPETQFEHTANHKIDVYSIAVLFLDIFRININDVYERNNTINIDMIHNSFRRLMKMKNEQEEKKFQQIISFVIRGLSKNPEVRPSLSNITQSNLEKSFNTPSSYFTAFCQKISRSMDGLHKELSKLYQKYIQQKDQINCLVQENEQMKVQIEERTNEEELLNDNLKTQGKMIVKLNEKVEFLENKVNQKEDENIALQEKVRQLETKLEQMMKSKQVQITILSEEKQSDEDNNMQDITDMVDVNQHDTSDEKMEADEGKVGANTLKKTENEL